MSLLDEHKVDDNKPHWLDFYSLYKQFIDIIEIRANRRLAVLHIAHKNNNAPYAFFIHGACARMSQFQSLIKDLSLKFNIIAYDRIGCGISDKPKEYDAYHDINIFTDLCVLFKTYLPQSSSLQNTQNEILIIAHSFGCSQTIKLLSKYGNASVYNYLVKSIILIGAAPFILSKPFPWTVQTLFSLPHCILEYLSPYLSASFRKNGIHSDSKEVHDLELTFSGCNPAYMFASFYRQIIPCSQQQFITFSRYHINTKIIHGECDKIVPLKYAQQLMDKLNKYQQNKETLIELEIVPNTSHQCMQENPQTVSKIIHEFWCKCSAK